MAATFDYARMNIYLATGRGEKAVAMLTERCKQMPDNYEPHGRLAQVLSSLGRYDEALVAIESALGKVKGPRRIRYLTMQADILAALRNTAREREVVKELVAAYEALPPSAKANPNNASGLAEAKQRLRALR
jgi:tetratricopeptide (TPR) repeat protein